MLADDYTFSCLASCCENCCVSEESPDEDDEEDLEHAYGGGPAAETPILEEPDVVNLDEMTPEPGPTEDSSLVTAVPALKRMKTWFLGKSYINK